jgi:phage major head subunit gpT-like protein
MDITPANIRALWTTFSAVFQEGYAGSPTFYDKVATVVPSSSKSNTYGWMSRLPQMREWLGDRVIQNVAAYGYQIQNKTFELTVAIPREDIEDDNVGVYRPIVQETGRAAGKKPDLLIADLLRNGQSTTGFDGRNFFAANHYVDPIASSGSQQNYWSTGKALTAANYAEVRASMMGFLGEDGLPLGVMPGLLIVPPQLELAARRIVQSDVIFESTASTNAAGTTNVLKGSAEVLVVPELVADATTWYLLDVSRAIKPFVFQTRRAINFVQKTSPNDDEMFFNNQVVYGVDGRMNAGVSLWWLAAKAVA